MLHHKDGIGQVIRNAWFPPDVTLGIQDKEFNLGFIRPEYLVSHGLRVFMCLLANCKRAVMCLLLRNGFRLATLSYRPDWCSAAEMVVLLEGSPISSEELWSSVRVTIGFLVTSLTKTLLPLIAQFGWAVSSMKSLSGSKLLPSKNDGGRCVLEDLQRCRNILVPFLRSVPRHNPVSELYE